jgi:hypothetical protein
MKTNLITRIDDKTYLLITEDGQEFTCGVWFEKKVERYHVLIPKQAREICGRTYVRTSLVGPDGYSFETKTEHREGLSGSSWKNKMTPEERDEYERLENEVNERELRMEEIKKVASSRELTEEQKLELQIAKLQAELLKLKK